MPVTKDQAHMLASLAVACRPRGAPHWDEAGVVAAIAKLNGLLLADVAHAVLRAAEDATAKTPGVITATSSIHWRERSPHHTTPLPPKAGEFCLRCGRTLDVCHSLPCDDERKGPVTRPTPEDQRRKVSWRDEVAKVASDEETS